VVREVMEGIYRKFDQSGVADRERCRRCWTAVWNRSSRAAEAAEWRAIVNRSHRQLAAEGQFDAALLERMQVLIDEFRGRTSE
jgi:hypothetical protein